jgi:type VI secretion system protein VasG
MVAVNLKSLVDKLNDTCRHALETAVGLTLSRTHYNVELEHWLLKLLETPNTDLTVVCRHYDVDTARLSRELTQTLDSLKTGNARPPVLSPAVVNLAREAWLLASVEFGSPHTRSGHLLCALLADETLGRQVRESSRELAKLSPETLRQELPALTARSAEAEVAAPPGGEPEAAQPVKPGGPSRTPALDQFTLDLTARARAGQIDPVLGRDAEIRQMIDILTRRRQNNPILTGEAGVGKTALAEGLALRIVAGDVPPALQSVSIRTLDLALLQAGAGVRGEFENRLKSVINEVKASPQPIIVFIDEAHTLIGAGGQAGQGDAANILKPALARGELRTIAATTWAEYKKYFEGDAALARRFQVIKVEEPTEPAAIAMLQGIVKILEAHHRVRILDEAVREAARLSHRYIAGRQLPDKAVSLLDTACARVALGNTATPPVIEDCRRQIEQLTTTMQILQREAATGAEHGERLTTLQQNKERLEEELAVLEQRWQQETALVTRIRELRVRLEAAAGEAALAEPLSDEQRQALRGELQDLTGQLGKLQGEAPLTQVCVDAQTVADVVSVWTGIPVGRMVTDEINAVLNLKQLMAARIIGQSHALEAIAQSISTARASLADPRRPIGVFLLVGPSGVGKTETAIVLAELLYGGDQNMTVINMSEFKEEHKVSLLMGSPPGYVGYREGGVLTEAVRRRPYSIVLLDEMEKAHSGVQDIFYQVFDKGMLRDGEGRDIDFKNTVIIMTSNAGTDMIMKLCADPETMPDAAGLAEALRPELLQTFKPAFLGRVTLVPYFPLSDEVLQTIIQLQMNRIGRRVQENYRAQFSYSPELVANIAARCHEVETGARNVDHILNRSLLPQLAAEFLSRLAENQAIRAVHVSLDETGNFRYEIS